MAVSKVHAEDRVQQSTRDKTQLSPWMLVWFYVTAIICTWDATFIMLRPHTLPGGSLATIWFMYKYYVTVDQRYMDTSDAFVFAQSLLNYAEVVINIITIVMHYRCSRHTTTTAFMVSVMTMWKTVLYFLMFSEFCTGGAYREGNSAVDEFFLVVIPNIIWIIVPICIMYALWHQLTPQSRDKVVSSLMHQKNEDQALDNGCSAGNGYSLAGQFINNDGVKGYLSNRQPIVKRTIK